MPSRSLWTVILAHSIALPLFGRAVFPMLRDKENISLASSFTDPQILATYLAGVVVMIGFFKKSYRPMMRARVTQVFMLFVAVCFASALGSRFLLFSVWRCLEVFLLCMWAVVVIRSTGDAGDPATATRAFYRISTAILVGVFVGLVINPSGAWSVEGDIARLTGTTGYSINPNDIGAIAAVLSVGCFVRAVERASVKYALATAGFIVVCFLAYSRGGYLAMAAGFSVAMLMLGRVVRRRAMIFIMSVCAVLSLGAIVLASPGLRDFFVLLMTRGHATENLESFGGRLQLWEFGLQIFKDHPLLGTGYGTYPKGLEGGHFHNVFIELLVTTGLVGTGAYVVFLVTLIVTIKKSIGRTDPRVIAERISAADLVTIPTVIIVANGATAGAAYYSWDLLGLMSVAVSSSLLIARRRSGGAKPMPKMQFSNLLR